MENVIKTLEMAIRIQMESILGQKSTLKSLEDLEMGEGKKVAESIIEIIEEYKVGLEGQQMLLKSLEEKLAVIRTAEQGTTVTEKPQNEILGQYANDTIDIFSIPLIFEKILGELDWKSLLNSRSVCKSWDATALKVFQKLEVPEWEQHTYLDLNKLFSSSNGDTIPDFNDGLTRRIYFDYICCTYNNGDKKYEEDSIEGNSLKTKFLTFCTKFSNQIEIMYLVVCPAFISTFTNVIGNNVPNLKVLHLDTVDFDRRHPEFEAQQQFYKPNLQKINCDIDGDFNNYSQIMQLIINGSNNLNRLELDGDFFPNLSEKKLKYLYYHGSMDSSFSQTKLATMLEQVKDSLESLNLSLFLFEDETEDRLNVEKLKEFRFPAMKMLQELKIDDVLLYSLEEHCGLQFSSMIRTIALKFPNLQELNITAPGSDQEAVDNLLNRAIQGQQFQLRNIKTVTLDKIYNPSNFLSHFKKWFPQLNKLHLYLLLEEDTPQNIETTFSALKDLKLKQLVLDLEFLFKFSDLVRALHKSKELLKGMKILEIFAQENFDRKIVSVIDDLKSHKNGTRLRQMFCSWLKTTKNMESVLFHGFNFSAETASRVISLINEMELPVEFENYY